MWELIIQHALERQRDLLREVESKRLVREALGHGHSGPADHVLSLTGRHLVAWGKRLQARGDFGQTLSESTEANRVPDATQRVTGSAYLAYSTFAKLRRK